MRLGSPILDTHLHVWEAGAPWMSWLDDRPTWWQPVRRDFTFPQLRNELDAADVAELILVQAGSDLRETSQLLSLAAVEPSVRGVIGWATLSSPADTTRALDALATGPGAELLVGIRNNHHWQPDGDILADPKVVGSCRVVAEQGLTLDLHVADDTELPLAVQLAERVPELTVVVDHLGKPRLDNPDAFSGWAASMRRLASLPNVYVKYSGWATFMRRTLAADVRPYINLVLDEFGSNRVMYGGNWPVALVAGSYIDTLRATLDAVAGRTSDELADILHRTAKVCYLAPPHGAKTTAQNGRPGGR